MNFLLDLLNRMLEDAIMEENRATASLGKVYLGGKADGIDACIEVLKKGEPTTASVIIASKIPQGPFGARPAPEYTITVGQDAAINTPTDIIYITWKD